MAFELFITEENIKNYPNDYELGNFIRKKYHKYLESEFDKCVECGLQTPYFVDTHIELRSGYIDGAGQGCFQKEICKK